MYDSPSIHQAHLPIPYPMTAPKIEQMLQIKANSNAFNLFPKAKGIRRMSGGTGKKEASAAEISPRTVGPLGLSAQDKTQSYVILINFILGNRRKRHR